MLILSSFGLRLILVVENVPKLINKSTDKGHSDSLFNSLSE